MDKCIFFVSPKIVGSGRSAFELMNKKVLGDAFILKNIASWNLHGDIMIEAYLHK